MSHPPMNPCQVLACIRLLVPTDGPIRDAELREFLSEIDRILAEVRLANERRYEVEAAA